MQGNDPEPKPVLEDGVPICSGSLCPYYQQKTTDFDAMPCPPFCARDDRKLPFGVPCQDVMMSNLKQMYRMLGGT